MELVWKHHDGEIKERVAEMLLNHATLKDSCRGGA